MSGTDVTPPTADIIDVDPDPRTEAVHEITVVFSEPVVNVDHTDFGLNRDGNVIPLTVANDPVSSDSGVTWVMPALTDLTDLPGEYVLTLRSAALDIEDLSGNPLAVPQVERWNCLPPEPRVYVDIDAASGGDGSSWDAAFNDLDLAIDAASELASLGIPELEQIEIWIAGGTYLPTRPQDAADPRSATFSMRSDTTLVGGFAGTETSAEERLRDGEGILVHETILSGDLGVADDLTDNAYTVVFASYQTDVVLDGLTVTNGYANGSGAFQYNCGGGVFLNRGSTTISDVTFTENYCIYYGGALRPLVATVTVDGCRFFDNHAVLEGTSTPQGGAINLANSSTTSITNSIFEGNTAYGGHGAIDMYYTPTVLEDCVFRGNEAATVGSGATHNYGSPVTYNRVLFEANSTAGPGGAVYAQFDATFNNCSFLANQSGEVGGGLYARSGVYVLVEQCEFVGNQSALFGGGMVVVHGDINRSTFTANHSNRGGGLACGGNDITLTSSLVAGNTTDDMVGADLSAPHSGQLSAQYSLIGTPSYWYDAGQYIDQYGNIIGPESDPIDPLFVRKPSDGGDGWGDDPATPGIDESVNDDYGDLHPQLASLAFNAGLEADPPLQTTDLDGHPRVVYGTIDIGAYEYQNSAPVADAGGPYEVLAEGHVTLDGTASFDPDAPHDSIVSYAWDFNNDGLFDDATGATPVFSAAGLPGGEFVVSLQVTDTEGAVHSDSATIVIFVSTLDLTATEGDDTIIVTPGSVAAGIDHVVEINGVSQTYSPFIREINIDGLGGEDSITINGTAENETADLGPGFVDVVGQTYEVHASNVESILVDANSGDDHVTMTGSTGSTEIHSYADYATLATSTGKHIGRSNKMRQSFFFVVEDFDNVTVTAPGSGRNEAYFYDSPDNDAFEATPESATMDRADPWSDIETTGFQRAYAFSINGGNDTAVLVGAEAGGNIFRGDPDESTLTDRSKSFRQSAFGFRDVTAIGSQTDPSSDRAYLHDSRGDDTLIGRGDSVILKDTAEADYQIEALYFDLVYARSVERRDDDTVDVDDSVVYDLILRGRW